MMKRALQTRTLLPARARAGLAALLALLLFGCAGLKPRDEEENAQLEGRDPYSLHRALGMTLLHTDRPAEALPHFRRLERLRPENPEPYYLSARVFMQMELHDPAEANLARALVADSEYAPAHALLGVLLDASGRHDCAAKRHRRALELAPDHAPYHNNLGFNLYVRQRYEEAVAAYQSAIALEPRSRRIHNNLGFAYGRLGEVDRARDHFLRGGTRAEAVNNLGTVYEELGDLEAAYDLYLAAAREEPDLGQAQSNLMRVSGLLERVMPAPMPEEEEG